MHYLPRRRGEFGIAGAHARQRSADHHTGSYKDYLRRHELEAANAARGDERTKNSFVMNLLPRMADPRNLRLAWDWISYNGGQAPGADGLCFDDLDEPDVWPLLRTVRRSILDETYRTAPDRQKKIPKASGKGFRTLTIPSIVDRLVQRAIVQTIQPYLDGFLDDHSLGYRSGSDINAALARAEQLAVAGNRWVWLTEDLRNAFDHVPQKRLLDVLRIHIPDERMMRLIERVVLTKTNRGLRQGGNLSPLFLNVYLDHFLDRRWRRQHPDIPLLRWADDLLVMCRLPEEARQAYQGLQRLLVPTGMALKGTLEQATHNLQDGAYADWLGYRLIKGENGLVVRLTEKAWKSLAEKLEQDHEKACSPLRAIQTIMGWISHLGPCFKPTDVVQTYTRIVTLARGLAFDEMPSLEEIRREWRSASRRWKHVRERMAHRD
ncbi:MAG TPA: reverse transcriptase domain-containing protein [Gemmataceae bacterium]|jgi:retron-type reverse transcriptase